MEDQRAHSAFQRNFRNRLSKKSRRLLHRICIPFWPACPTACSLHLYLMLFLIEDASRHGLPGCTCSQHLYLMLSWLKMHLGMDCLAALALCICIWCFLCLKMHLLVWSRIFLHHILEKSWLEDADFFSGQRKSDFGKSRMRFFQIDASSNGNPTKYKMHFKLDSTEFQQKCILLFWFSKSKMRHLHPRISVFIFSLPA